MGIASTGSVRLLPSDLRRVDRETRSASRDAIARLLRACDTVERGIRAAADSPSATYRLALCAHWRQELERRLSDLEQGAFDAAIGLFIAANDIGHRRTHEAYKPD